MARNAPRTNPPRTSLRKRLAKQVAPTVEKQGAAIEKLGAGFNAHERRLRVLERSIGALIELAIKATSLEEVTEALNSVGLQRDIPQDPAHEG